MAHIFRKATLFLVLAFAAASSAPALAGDAASFYAGKTIRVIVGYGGGSTFDAYSRVVVRHMPSHIPGNPTMIVQNMPGAGSLKATGYMANAAPRDGLTIAMPNPVNTTEPLLDPKRANFDARSFQWIGSVNTEISTCGFWGSKVNTIADLQNKKVVVGATGASSGSTVDAETLKRVLGFNFKIVTGYPGLAEARLAAVKGEIDGHCGLLVSSIKTELWDDFQNGKVKVLIQMGTRKHPDIPNIPNAFDLVKSEQDRQVLKLIFGPWSYGRPLMAPAGVPKARVDILRAAFEATMKDPEFLAEAKKRRMEVQPVSADRIVELIADIYRTPTPVIERARDILGIDER